MTNGDVFRSLTDRQIVAVFQLQKRRLCPPSKKNDCNLSIFKTWLPEWGDFPDCGKCLEDWLREEADYDD